MSKIWPYNTPGVPDQIFLRINNIPITTAEIRAVVISKLKLFDNAIGYDIGAGTGSVAVEMGLLTPKGQVFALEQKTLTAELVEKNVHKFGLKNVRVIKGDAVKSMGNLPQAHRIFIGGSGGKLKEILTTADQKLLPGGIMAATSVTLNTAPGVHGFFIQKGYIDIEVVSINLARTATVGNLELWRANNPVQIVVGQKPS